MAQNQKNMFRSDYWNAAPIIEKKFISMPNKHGYYIPVKRDPTDMERFERMKEAKETFTIEVPHTGVHQRDTTVTGKHPRK